MGCYMRRSLPAGVILAALCTPILLAQRLCAPTQESVLCAPAPTYYARLGTVVAVDGDTAVIGVEWANDVAPNAGVVHVFVRVGGEWIPQATLTAGDAMLDGHFGRAVALEGNTLAVGAYDSPNSRGFVYTFTRAGGPWTQQSKIECPMCLGSNNFGAALALRGDELVVGAPGSAAYVYTRAGDAWSLSATLKPYETEAVNFGMQVAMDGDVIAVGAPDSIVGGHAQAGMVCVFRRWGTFWLQHTALTASDAGAYDNFGIVIALEGTTLMIGAPGADLADINAAGAAYVFERTDNTWSARQKLILSDAFNTNLFGCAVSLQGDRMLCGAKGQSGPWSTAGGSACLFIRTATGWVLDARFAPDEVTLSEQFGAAVAMDGDTLLIGAPDRTISGVPNAGVAYLFDAACDPDDDDDGWTDAADNCPHVYNSSQADGDGDGVGDDCDNCAATANPDQHDTDFDGRGDVCDACPGDPWNDGDADGVCADADNCPTTSNPDQTDSDADGLGDVCDLCPQDAGNDADGDGICGDLDNCPTTANPAQADGDGDGVGDLCDNCPVVANPDQSNVDGDGPGDACDTCAGPIELAQFRAPSADKAHWQGRAVAIDGDTLALGTWQVDGVPGAMGGAYVWVRSGSAWTLQAPLTPVGYDYGLFGFALALECDVLVVGAPGQLVADYFSGAAYVYVRDGAVWSLEATLAPPDGGHGDRFGESVALDGDTIVVGAPLASHNGHSHVGAAYVFVRSAGVWNYQAKLVDPDNPGGGDEFGHAVAIEGDACVIGAPDTAAGVHKLGAAHAFVRSGTTWSRQARLIADEPEAPNDFGTSVVMHAGLLVIGADHESAFWGPRQGAAYVFKQAQGSWVRTAVLHPATTSTGGRFGASVAATQTSILVGAPEGQGIGRVFVSMNGMWSEQSVIVAADGDNGDTFGTAVGLSGDTAIVGAPGFELSGKAYLYHLGCNPDDDGDAVPNMADNCPFDANGNQLETDGDGFGDACDNCPLVPNLAQADRDADGIGDMCDACPDDPSNDRDADGLCGDVDNCPAAANPDQADSDADGIGDACDACPYDADNDRDADGVCGDIDNCPTRYNPDQVDTDGDGWGDACDVCRAAQQLTKLGAPDAAANDRYGNTLAAEGSTLVVGAYRADHAGGVDAGAVYVLSLAAVDWQVQAKLIAPDAQASDAFGTAVALQGDTLVVGAERADLPGKADAGAAYVFRRSGNAWAFEAKLIAGDGAANDNFGHAVAVWGDRIVVGAYRAAQAGGAAAGAAYVFNRSGTTWTQQLKLGGAWAVAGDWLGYTVACTDVFILMGAPRTDAPGLPDSGAVHSLYLSGTNQNHTVLRATDPGAADLFGMALAVQENTLVIGAQAGDHGLIADTGAAYMLARSGNHWEMQGKLVAADAVPGDWFGTSIAVAPNRIVIGAARDGLGGVNAGAAYVFAHNETEWLEQAVLRAADAAPNNLFGSAVTITGDTAIVGAYLGDQTNGTAAGATYLFDLNCRALADIDVDGDVDWDDAVRLGDCTLGPDNGYGIDCHTADLDGDHDVDLHDLVLFQTAFGE